MRYEEINKIYFDIIQLIIKQKPWSNTWKGLIIILPPLILDIHTINSTDNHLKSEIFLY